MDKDSTRKVMTDEALLTELLKFDKRLDLDDKEHASKNVDLDAFLNAKKIKDEEIQSKCVILQNTNNNNNNNNNTTLLYLPFLFQM